METTIYDKWTSQLSFPRQEEFTFKINDDALLYAVEVFNTSLPRLFACDVFLEIIDSHHKIKMHSHYIDMMLFKQSHMISFEIDLNRLIVDKHVKMFKTSDPKVYIIDGILMKPGNVEKIKKCLEDKLIKEEKRKNKIDRMVLISGPFDGSEHKSQKYDKHIYMFGDHHNKLGDCKDYKSKNIADFIADVLSEQSGPVGGSYDPNDIVDVFIEVGFKPKGQAFEKQLLDWTPTGRMEDTYMRDIVKKFSNCLQPTKAFCQYKNARFHYSDIRNKFKFLRIGAEVTWEGTDNWNFNHGMVTEPKQVAFMENLKRTVHNNNTFQDFLYYKKRQRDLHQDAKITKQLSNIGPSYLKKKIREYYNGKVSTLFDEADKYLISYKKTRHDADLLDFILVVVEIGVLIQDYYMVARMFRSFNSPGREGPPIRKVLIYAGAAHTKNIREFFNTIQDMIEDYRYTSGKLHRIDNTELSSRMIDPKDLYQCVDIGSRVPLFK